MQFENILRQEAAETFAPGSDPLEEPIRLTETTRTFTFEDTPWVARARMWYNVSTATGFITVFDYLAFGVMLFMYLVGIYTVPLEYVVMTLLVVSSIGGLCGVATAQATWRAAASHLLDQKPTTYHDWSNRMRDATFKWQPARAPYSFTMEIVGLMIDAKWAIVLTVRRRVEAVKRWIDRLTAFAD